ncbi:WD40-repeat-containing domain protein [Sordaria brevicollis]|uniref:WD40-repeat-containing domain protein n=1 Tax=Sordaria brevicollis TaxID=83679 RepID=A0AAE0U646_SORBR|nr:WD40-repeat-containing domain protein [Sordaria brevicollis]
MSKQYLTLHTVDQAHPTEIFSLAPTSTSLISASGSSHLLIHSTTTSSSFPLSQTLSNAHRLGCHHLATSRSGPGNTFASVGFGGETKIWRRSPDTDKWSHYWTLPTPTSKTEKGDVWAVSLSQDEGYLACTTSDGRIHVWDLEGRAKVQTYETGASAGGGNNSGNGGGNGVGTGSFAMAVDLSRDGKFTASGHENGGVYVFNNDAGRMVFSLSGLAKPIRTLSFSPGCRRLAAAGNAGIIAIYDMQHGEHVANLVPTGSRPAWITSIDWNDTGEYLLSGSLDGKVRVWDVAKGVCVATHSETESAIWSVKWLPKSEKTLAPGMGKGEMFVAAGANRSLTFYREATGS